MAKGNTKVIDFTRTPPRDIDPDEPLPVKRSEIESSRQRVKVFRIPLADIRPDPEQPREHFDAVALQELADSLKDHGQIEPCLVKPDRTGSDTSYILIAGERRWRAAKIAGLPTLECKVEERKLTDQQKLVIQYAENERQAGLTALERARAYQRVLDETPCTYGDLANIFKTPKSTISKALKALRTLTEEEQQLAKEFSVEQLYEVAKVNDHQERSRQISLFKSGAAPTREVRRATDITEARTVRRGTIRKKTIQGVKFSAISQKRLTSAELVPLIRVWLESLENDGRSKA